LVVSIANPNKLPLCHGTRWGSLRSPPTYWFGKDFLLAIVIENCTDVLFCRLANQRNSVALFTETKTGLLADERECLEKLS
jgi:hypothetical protein